MKSTTTITILASLLLAACGSEKEQSSESETTNNQSGEADSLVADTMIVDSAEAVLEETHMLSEETLDLYKKYLETEIWEDVKTYVSKAYNVKTDHDFYLHFVEAQRIREALSEACFEIPTPITFEAYDFVVAAQPYNRELEGLYLSCVAECTENQFTLDMAVYDSLAKLTDGKEDDAFVSLWQLAESNYGHMGVEGFKNWFGQTWDYGGSSLIGDSSAYNFLISYDKFVDSYGDNYNVYLDEVRYDALNMMHTFRSYMYTAEKVIQELKATLENVTLTEEEKGLIEARIEALQDPEANEIEVNCEEGNCAYG